MAWQSGTGICGAFNGENYCLSDEQVEWLFERQMFAPTNNASQEIIKRILEKNKPKENQTKEETTICNAAMFPLEKFHRPMMTQQKKE
jgi:spermidine/putrescine-binding protein